MVCSIPAKNKKEKAMALGDKLKKFRIEKNWTQKDLAGMLDTTQQTIARWESDQVEPSLAALRDLAVLFGTTVDALVGKPSGTLGVGGTPIWDPDLDDSEQGFWGHVGVLLPGTKESQWFPVTQGEVNKLGNALRRQTRAGWMNVATLNNRALLINTAAVKKITLLNDNEDSLESDPVKGWDVHAGEYLPAELYSVLALEWLGGAFEDEASDKLLAIARDVVRKNKWTPEEMFDVFSATKVHRIDGSAEILAADGESLAEAWLETELAFDEEDDEPWALANLHFDCQDVGGSVFVSRAQVAMIDMPLHLVRESSDLDFADLDFADLDFDLEEAPPPLRKSAVKKASAPKVGANVASLKGKLPENVSVEDLGLTARVSRALRERGISTAAQLSSMTKTQLIAVPRLGRLTAEQIEQNLAQAGLKLST